MDGIAAVEARIAQIQAQFGAPSVAATSVDTSDDAAASSDLGTAAVSSTSGTDFASALSAAQGTGSIDPTSPTTASRTQWANDFLNALGMPTTSSNVTALVAWQQAEGTRAQFNPLATTQDMPGATRFNSVGVKNFATYQDGITANVKALTNGRYSNILAALQQGTSSTAVAQAIANSPWGTGTGVLRVLGAG